MGRKVRTQCPYLREFHKQGGLVISNEGQSTQSESGVFYCGKKFCEKTRFKWTDKLVLHHSGICEPCFNGKNCDTCRELTDPRKGPDYIHPFCHGAEDVKKQPQVRASNNEEKVGWCVLM